MLFLNFLLPRPARPISPVPNRIIVAGSGTGRVVGIGLLIHAPFAFVCAIMVSVSISPSSKCLVWGHIFQPRCLLNH
jgi:hypothetical protein